MNKFMLNSLALLTLTCGQLLADPYAQFATSSPVTYPDSAIISFDETIHRHKIDIVPGPGSEFRFDSAGTYKVDFSAIGVPVNGVPVAGYWGLQLQLNGQDLPGGAFIIQVTDPAERLSVSGSTLVKIHCKSDRLRLVVQASDPSPISADLSANIVISRVNDAHDGFKTGCECQQQVPN